MKDKWYEVESSNIDAIRYDPNGLCLDVRFVTGKIYRHLGVKPRTVTEMMWGDSAGKSYHAKIRDIFPSTLLEETGAPVTPRKSKPKRVQVKGQVRSVSGTRLK